MNKIRKQSLWREYQVFQFIKNSNPSEKIQNPYQNTRERSRSGTELLGTSDYKKRLKQNESFLSSIPGYVDYSEIINDWGSKFDRIILSPEKEKKSLARKKENSSPRRTRAMRSHVNSKEKGKRFTPNSSFVREPVLAKKTQRKKENVSFISYNARPHTIRSSTPLLHRKPKGLRKMSNLSIHENK